MSRRLPLPYVDLVSPTWPAFVRLAEVVKLRADAVNRAELGPHHLFVAADDCTTPVGVLLVCANRRGQADTLHVVVHPAQRRRGVGRALYAAATAAGIDVEALSGRGGLTADGSAFRAGRRVQAGV